MRQSAQAWCALPSTCSPCGGDGPAAPVSPCSDGLLAGTVLIDENGAPLLTEGGECIDVTDSRLT